MEQKQVIENRMEQYRGIMRIAQNEIDFEEAEKKRLEEIVKQGGKLKLTDRMALRLYKKRIKQFQKIVEKAQNKIKKFEADIDEITYMRA
jgi:tellurite resistance protein